MRRQSRIINIGGIPIGGGHPVAVQSMTTTDTRDVKKTVQQIKELQKSGCELVRVAVVDEEAARAIAAIKEAIEIPLIADIHFDYRLALESIKAGCDALRINPGNIGDTVKIQSVVRACKDQGIPIRIGVNAGSLSKEMLSRYGGVCAEAMVESAMEDVRILEDMDFRDIKISLKASSVMLTIEAYQMIAGMVDYPLHIGITEAGTINRALIKSAMGIGILLHEGIGDTLRVSLTADPVEEVWAAYEILRSAGIRRRGVELISCPTCGRCNINLIDIANEVDQKVRKIDKDLTVAVMGCVVNGPGEAREADLGIAGGQGVGILFKHGETVRKIPQNQMVNELLKEIEFMDE